MDATMLPTSLPGILPALPQDEFQLPSLRNIDTKRKRKTNKQRLPTLGSLGGRNTKGRRTSDRKSSSRRAEDLSSGLSKLIGGERNASAKKPVSQAAYNKGSLEELLEVVKTIEEECLLEPEKDQELEKDLDPFFKCKNAIVHVIEETRDLIEQRRRILETRGHKPSSTLLQMALFFCLAFFRAGFRHHSALAVKGIFSGWQFAQVQEKLVGFSCAGTTYEAIAKRSAVTDNIAYLKKKFQELGALYAQQYKQRKSLNLSEEELDDRHQQLNALLKEIELIHKLSKGAALAPSASLERGSAIGLAELASRQPVTEGSWENGGSFEPQPEELTEEDQIVLQRWKERDKQFDAQVAQIGDAIDRIADVAVTIGQQADIQNQMVEDLTLQTNQAAAELQLLDSKLKKFMKEHASSNFFCKLILLLLVMLLICFVFSTVYARYIKKA